MKLRIDNLKIPMEEDGQEFLINSALKALKVGKNEVKGIEIKKKSLDARNKQQLFFVYTVELELKNQALLQKLIQNKRLKNISLVEEEQKMNFTRGSMNLKYPPIIVGAGPAGLFAAFELAEAGFRPIIVERGKKVEERTEDINKFWQKGELHLESNVQFGEGGAGTFSDGKLTSRSKDPRVARVLDVFVQCGALEEIKYVNKPHLGTDGLREIVKNMRNKIIALGGTFYFEAKVTDLVISNEKVQGVIINGEKELKSEQVILAIGHSARDTYELLKKREVYLEQKPFALGVRIEHSQAFIDQAQYGAAAGHPNLGAADYRLTYQSEEYKKGAYSFCMCPGGKVIASSSEPNTVVTNGMSEYKRDSGTANSALVVTVGPKDYESEDVLAGIEFQRIWEKKAFQLGGGDYTAPAQKVEDFLEGRATSDFAKGLKPTYQPKVTGANLYDCLPQEVGLVLKEAISKFGKMIPGFAENAVLTGVETRTSSPVRIKRNEALQSVNIAGLYPAGEGAGYAGGIVSAAVDGQKVAEAIISVYALPKTEK